MIKKLRRWWMNNVPSIFPTSPSKPGLASGMGYAWKSLPELMRERVEADHVLALAENERRAVADADGITKPLLEGAL